MALAHLVLRTGFLAERRDSILGVVASSSSLSGGGNGKSRVSPGFFPLGLRSFCVIRRGRLNVTESQIVENNQIRTGVEIPVTCYQIVGVPNQAEKDEIVKAVMELRSAEIEEGYTLDVVVSRQDLLMDVRDKLLFEPEYAGNAREKVVPKSSLCIPWAWLPGALCLLQEVGEEKLVLEIGREALQHADAKPYIHDLFLSMALAECSIAKAGFEKSKVSQGFEALARAQYLLRSRPSLEKMPLLSEIEESLEELAPACALELLSFPQVPENSERRLGANAALRELLRQGLQAETSCRILDWPWFLSQALNKLMAAEIIDLLPWDNLAITRKNKKSLESLNQRVVIDFNCFYMAMIAHIAIGFSNRQTELINKAKIICECLIASEGIDLKFEEGLCSFLLGQGGEAVVSERLRQLEINGSPASWNFEHTVSDKEIKNSASMNQSLEIWLKDAVLGMFTDTRDCSPSLANFFRGEKKILSGSKQNKGTAQTIPSVNHRSLSFFHPPDNRDPGEPLSHMNSTRQKGVAVKQLAPANLNNQLMVGKNNSSPTAPQLKRNLGTQHKKVWEGWWATGDMAGRITLVTVTGCFVLTAFRLLHLQFGQIRTPSRWHNAKPKLSMSDLAWTTETGPACIDRNNIVGRLGGFLGMFKEQLKHPLDAGTMKNSWPVDDLSLFTKAPAGARNFLHKRQMPLEEAEALVKQWQDIKAEALGFNHEVNNLSEVLAESMLDQWQALAESAKARSCFWRFVLLQLSVVRAEIVSNVIGEEIAEIEALLEEAAELVDESQLKNPNYYSTYKIRYVLKRQNDGSWRFCGGGIQTPS
ncbi:plastid division protein [Tasmannia lanceolata]|uniref:plastid division protein n=1 Tax=Tasmannia lanceolata TaxID=3420 RepID=UPI004063F6EE